MFKPQFAVLVRNGAKRQTIRPVPKRMPVVGEKESWRQWIGRPYWSGQVECALVELTAVQRISMVHGDAGLKVVLDGKEMDMVDVCSLAVNDGFETAADMFLWFHENHGAFPFHGILIKGKDASRCELRPGIGLCDECTLPKWPQEDKGFGFMVCLDCLHRYENDVAMSKGHFSIDSARHLEGPMQALKDPTVKRVSLSGIAERK